jgi:hypothetical protein
VDVAPDANAEARASSYRWLDAFVRIADCSIGKFVTEVAEELILRASGRPIATSA